MTLKLNKAFLLFFYSLFICSLSFGSKKNSIDNEKKIFGTALIRSNYLPIPIKFLPSDLNAYTPDSCVLFTQQNLSVATDSVSKKKYYYFTINKKVIRLNGSLASVAEVQTLLESIQKLGYFKEINLLYFDNKRKINRSITVNYLAKKLKELRLVSRNDNLVDVLLYSQQGTLLSKTLNRVDTVYSKWYNLYNVKKIGQSLYHQNGSQKASINYEDGLISDTLTFFNMDGVVSRQYIYSKGNVVKTLVEPIRTPNSTASNYKKALLIGINQYTRPVEYTAKEINDKFIEVYNIAGSVNDVNLIKSKLISGQGFNKENVSLLTDGQATKAGILQALNNFAAKLLPSDIAFLHFSALSYDATKVKDGNEVFILASDYYKGKSDTVNTYWITKKEIEQVFDAIKKKIGSKGQLIVSYDACGQSADNAKDEKKNEVQFRGEQGSLLFSSKKYTDVPFVILSGTSGDELSMEASKNGVTYGIYSYALANALALPYSITDEDLINEVRLNVTKQNPNYYSNFPQYLFEQNQSSTEQGVTLAEIKPKGNAHIISVGISKYPKTGKLSFLNCVADATSYNQYFTDQYKSVSETGNVSSYLLTDSLATKKNILDAINKTMTSKPEDYFVFNFSGYTVPLKDSLGKQLTYFIPYGLKTLTDTAEIKKNGISLVQLKDLLQMIPANNQLFITEAGSTTNFQKEFIKNLIENSPTLAAISNKNRVFIVPKGAGMDNMVCNNRDIKHGPLNYYITNLTSDLNIYGLFENDLYINALKYAIGKAEADCDYIRSGYFDVFFEKNFISDLQYFMPEQAMQMRGAKIRNQTKEKLTRENSKRYALVIGTNTYKASAQWGNLSNPTLDAKAIADELENNYNYKVTRLIDKPLDTIYNKVLMLSKLLKESDQLVIFVAGHGDFDDNLLDDGLIVVNDSKPSSDDPFRNSYIQYSKLSRMINNLPPNQILLLLDVCFGGTFDDRVANNVSRGADNMFDMNALAYDETVLTNATKSGEGKYADLNANTYIEGKLGKKTRVYITSGGKKEVPDGYAGKHSPFAQRLIMALQGKGGANNLLTAKNLYQFVEKLPSGPLLGSFGDDKPGSEFLLIPNITPPAKPTTVAKN
ncbi:caspase family protein [Pedobacter frigiditerrae]|uniref:caspase family protein n=1 Tax=Pedobacter frigiditerrae TaxID=2530452 RepID=UPI00292F3F94|nr:caspase family protein [Pedobacter frigiditerrae]